MLIESIGFLLLIFIGFVLLLVYKPIVVIARYFLVWRSKNADLPNLGGDFVRWRLGTRLPGGIDQLLSMCQKKDGTFPSFFNFGFSMNGSQAIAFMTADLVRRVLLDEETFSKNGYNDTVGPLLGRGLATSEGQLWHQQRHLLTPLFHLKKLRSYFPMMNEESDRLMKDLLESGQRGQIAAHPVATFARATLRVVARAAFGSRLDLPWMSAQWRFLIDHMSIMFLAGMYSNYHILAQLPGPVQRYDVKMRELDAALIKAVREARAEAANGVDADDLMGQQAALVDTQTGAPLITDQQIIDESKTFLFAGQETTSNLLAWAMFYLACDEQLQNELLAEHDRVLAPTKGVVSEENLKDLKLTDAVLNEVLRLRPAMPSLDRLLTKDIEIDGRHFDKGTTITCFLWAPQMSTEHWHEPRRFDPRRWLGEARDERHPFAYVPFSAGPRNCIGQRLSKQEAVIFLTNIVKHFRIVATPENLASVKMAMKPTSEPDGLEVRFVPRE